jgi:hypothetical protein
MNNGIVVSVSSVFNKNYDIEHNHMYKQLSYSLNTLRKVNKNISVKVYYSYKKELPKNHSVYFPEDPNTEFIFFENNVSPDWHSDFWSAEIVEHRWINAFKALEDFNFDNIINMDTDTQFFIDPEVLFEKYGNTEFLWSREDTCDDLTKTLKIYPAINDGITVISKNILKHKNMCLSSMKQYINYTLEKYKTLLSEKDYHQLPWVIIQYSVFDYFSSRNLHRYFDKDDVLMHIEDKKDTHIIHHYFSSNSKKFLPEWPAEEIPIII